MTATHKNIIFEVFIFSIIICICMFSLIYYVQLPPPNQEIAKILNENKIAARMKEHNLVKLNGCLSTEYFYKTEEEILWHIKYNDKRENYQRDNIFFTFNNVFFYIKSFSFKDSDYFKDNINSCLDNLRYTMELDNDKILFSIDLLKDKDKSQISKEMFNEKVISIVTYHLNYVIDNHYQKNNDYLKNLNTWKK